MRVLILGFGKNAKELTRKIKSFPEFGDSKEVYIAHIQVARNSLSYGPELVVEIPDPMGDGWRTYKDGFQAVHSMSTTVSDFLDWAVEEMAHGSFSHVIDCTSENQKSKELIVKLVAAAKPDVRFILDAQKQNDIPGIEKHKTWYSDNVFDTISILRGEHDGGKPWTPVQFSKKTLEEAKQAWDEARVEMRRLHLEKRTIEVTNRGVPEASRDLDGYEFLENVIPDVDIETLYRFVVFGDPSGDYEKTTTRQLDKKCTVINHEMLHWFYGRHCFEGIASFVFCEPSLQIESASYYRYESENSVAMDEKDYDYAIEYVLSGELRVTAPSGREYLVPPRVAYYYRPKVNAPLKSVKLGTETLMLYYKET